MAVAWIGYDQPRSLGKDETGGKAALPIWIRYMATALQGKPDLPYIVPAGIMEVKINSYTGTHVYEDEPGLYEYFYQENPPPATYVDLTPLEELPEAYNPDSAFPNSMTDNPLQPQPPPLPPAPNQPQNNAPSEKPAVETPKPATPNKNSNDGVDSATRILNPSGF